MSNRPMPSVSLLKELGRFRRRAIRVAFGRNSSVACALALIAAAGAVAAARPTRPIEMLLVASAMAAAIVGAAIATFVRAPDLRQVAGDIDDRCGFDDVLATAVQFAATDDLVSRLIVHQAENRLSTVSLAEAVPHQWWPGTKLLVGACAAAVFLFAGGIAGFPPRSGPPPAGSEGLASTTSGSKRAEGRSGTPSSAAIQSRREPPTGASADMRDRSSNEPRTREQTPFGEKATAPGSPSGTADDVAGQSGRPAAASAQADVSAPRAAPPNAAMGSRSASDAGSSSGSHQGEAGGGTGARATQTPKRAGGVSAGQTSTSIGRESSVRNGRYAAQYRDALGRAETALVREQVPAEVRDTVRAYFTAIRP